MELEEGFISKPDRHARSSPCRPHRRRRGGAAMRRPTSSPLPRLWGEQISSSTRSVHLLKMQEENWRSFLPEHALLAGALAAMGWPVLTRSAVNMPFIIAIFSTSLSIFGGACARCCSVTWQWQPQPLLCHTAVAAANSRQRCSLTCECCCAALVGRPGRGTLLRVTIICVVAELGIEHDHASASAKSVWEGSQVHVKTGNNPAVRAHVVQVQPGRLAPTEASHLRKILQP